LTASPPGPRVKRRSVLLMVCVMDRPSGLTVTDHVSTKPSSIGSVDTGKTEIQNPPIQPLYPIAFKAHPVSLPENCSLDAATSLMLSACLDHFVANWPTLNSPAESEGVHQMRVSLRRLRAGVSVLRRAIESAELETAASRAKDIATKLGEARDLDVFSQNLEAGCFNGLRGEPSYYALLDAVEWRRREAHERVRALIRQPQTRLFVSDLRAALAERAWSGKSLDAAQPAFATGEDGSARRFAEYALDRLHRRAVKKCRRLADRSEQEWHKARIALKKSRYAAEFFESLFNEEERARSYIRSVTKMQDRLGRTNDVATASRLLDEMDAANRNETAFAAGFVRGWRARAQEFAAKDARRSEKASKQLEPFWR
jgi:triphosphatase